MPPSHVLDVAGEVRRGEWLARRLLDKAIPPHRQAGTEDTLGQKTPRLRPPDEAPALPRKRRRELGRHELPVEIRVVVHGRAGDVDLRGPVRRLAPVRTAHELVP